MKSNNYNDARSDLRETARDLKKDVREEARETFNTVKDAAREKKQEIKDEFRATRDMERAINDSYSRQNIRDARKEARAEKDSVNYEVSQARENIDDERVDFRDNVAQLKHEARQTDSASSVYRKAERMADSALSTENAMETDMLGSLDDIENI